MSKLVKKTIAKMEPKQVLMDVIDIPGLKVIPIRTRKFVQFDFDFTPEGTEVKLPQILPHQVADAIVRINIRINQQDIHKIAYKELEEILRKYTYIMKPIVPSIQRIRKTRIRKMTTDLNPLDAIKLWLAEKNIKNPDKVFAAAEELMRS